MISVSLELEIEQKISRLQSQMKERETVTASLLIALRDAPNSLDINLAVLSHLANFHAEKARLRFYASLTKRGKQHDLLP
jgi:hypothetical protein